MYAKVRILTDKRLAQVQLINLLDDPIYLQLLSLPSFLVRFIP